MPSEERRKSKRFSESLASAQNGDGDPTAQSPAKMQSEERRKSKRLSEALAPAQNGNGDPTAQSPTKMPSEERRKSKRLSEAVASAQSGDGDPIAQSPTKMLSEERRKSKRLSEAPASAQNGDGDPTAQSPTKMPSVERRKSRRLSQPLSSAQSGDGDATPVVDKPVSNKSAVADEPASKKSVAAVERSGKESSSSSKKTNRHGDATPVAGKPVSKKSSVEDEPASKKSAVVDEPGCEKSSSSSKKTNQQETSAEKPSKRRKKNGDESNYRFIGEPIPSEEAKKRWPERYGRKKQGTNGLKSYDEEEVVLRVKCHYLRAEVDGITYDLNDCTFVKAEEGQPDYIGRIVEFFETTNQELYFTAQWFYKPEDTVIKEQKGHHDPKRVFISELRDANLLDCIVSKISILRAYPNMDIEEKKKYDFYYDMSYSIPYSSFENLSSENDRVASDASSTISSEAAADGAMSGTKTDNEETSSAYRSQNSEMALLDLYSGCGAMSTGLCLGANLAGVNLVTRWAVDINEYACKSLKHNHPETQVRNESADDFLALLKEWEKLCNQFGLKGTKKVHARSIVIDSDDDEQGAEDANKISGEFEVEKFVGICFGKTDNIHKRGLKFKVRWKGYGPSEDTWEPMEGLSKCKESLKDFVTKGYKSSILPLPGDVDVICGGPPCQGISGFNRFRKTDAPLEDPKNEQMVVYMDIVEYLKPKYALMENVVDILKFAGGFLGRYALSRLVSIGYQARLGIMAAGSFGLPQFRLRAFLWGASPFEKLPPYPLPTHDVVVRGNVPVEFERSVVGFDEDQSRNLEKALLLGDAISDLPLVTNCEGKDEMPYGKEPLTEFQKYIRLQRHEFGDSFAPIKKKSEKPILFDHRPLQLNEDDYQRVCQIPKRKGANFRDLPGVKVRPDNIVEWDENVARVYLPSGKPLVPDYAMSFVKGKSSKPFGRLWYDETVPTVVTRAEPHNQAILHPMQDRVLTIRENARLQGFPDYYKLFGPVKERYIQVGNAVAVPVARALGYSLGCAFRRTGNDEPLMLLPPKFPHCFQKDPASTAKSETEASEENYPLGDQ